MWLNINVYSSYEGIREKQIAILAITFQVPRVIQKAIRFTTDLCSGWVMSDLKENAQLLAWTDQGREIISTSPLPSPSVLFCL